MSFAHLSLAELRWVVTHGLGSQKRPRSLAVQGGRIAVTGVYSDVSDGEVTANVGGLDLTGNSNNIFEGVYSANDGAHLWSKGFGSLGGGTLDPPGVLGGAFAARYTLDGIHLASRGLGGNSGLDIAATQAGNVVSYFTDPLYFEDVLGAAATLGAPDIFLMRIGLP